MSNISEDGQTAPVASSDSFWEIGQYKRTVKRIDDGLHLCQDLITLVKERGEIEAMHAKHLGGWSKKWAELIGKGPEYGTSQASWRAVLEEAEKLSELHSRMRDRLQEEVQNTIKLWSKEHFHKNAFGAIKESKDVEDSFKKAQKPWAKFYSKVDKCKKEYHVACRAERSAINQEKNAQADSSISADQTKKLTEKVEKCREEVQKAKENYQKSLDEINAYNAKYMEDMCQVFERCQEMERKRLKFFKEMLLGVHKCLDISNESKLQEIYENFQQTVDLADDNQDLKWWAQNIGTGMAMNWPIFEEYSPELRRIGKEPKAKEGVTLLGQKTTVPSAEYYQKQLSDRQNSNSTSQPLSSVNNNSINGGSNLPAGGHAGISNPVAQQQNSSDPNPFDDDWDTTPETLVDSGDPGVPVKALYDYEGQEEDELSFKKGDIFDKLEDEDEQGWCKGRKDGRLGLYPANYVELVQS